MNTGRGGFRVGSTDDGPRRPGGRVDFFPTTTVAARYVGLSNGLRSVASPTKAMVSRTFSTPIALNMPARRAIHADRYVRHAEQR